MLQQHSPGAINTSTSAAKRHAAARGAAIGIDLIKIIGRPSWPWPADEQQPGSGILGISGLARIGVLRRRARVSAAS